jgi:hypothetical protein
LPERLCDGVWAAAQVESARAGIAIEVALPILVEQVRALCARLEEIVP